MYLFLITFLTLYGGIHLYVFLKLRAAFRPKPHQKLFLAAALAFMTVTPLLVRTAEHSGAENIAEFIAWPGFIWMGFIFILAVILIFTDLLHCGWFIVGRFLPTRRSINLSAATVITLALIMATVASGYALVEANRIRTEHIVISSAKLPASAPTIRIVQISDVHVGLLMREQRLQRILEKVREAAPHILVSTGDLVDGKLNRDDTNAGPNHVAALLASASAPSGKYAILGNHEVYAGLPAAVAFTGAAGFTLLRNQSVPLPCGVTISGVDDRAAYQSDAAASSRETAVINAVAHDSFHLLLKHRPDILPQSDGRFDLQLSGHTHDGQIFPFNYLVRLKYPIPFGTNKTKAGSLLHISRGTGTWGPPMRLFAPPEVTIIDIFGKQPV